MMQSTPRHGGYGFTGVGLEAINVRTLFGYMFPQLVNDPDSRLPQNDPAQVREVRENLKALGELMATQSADKGDSTIAAGYTYWGQFIDHDVTLNDLSPLAGRDIVDVFEPMAPGEVIRTIVNLRRPTLDLDSVFGDGPRGEAAHFYQPDGIRLKIGSNVIDGGGATPPPASDLNRDLPRDPNALPLIGDARNDENLIVAQLHVGFMRFYNAVVDRLAANGLSGVDLLKQAVKLVRWQYQWLVVNDYLMTVAQKDVVQDVVDHGGKFFRPSADDAFEPFMPLEFSVAAFRFGHSMVRADYDFNRNFGRNRGGPGILLPDASLDLLFRFTGTGGFNGTKVLPHNWIIEWDRFFPDKNTNMARKIDVGLALPLAQLPNETNTLMKHLAVRNLLRGYLFSLPTGQAVAATMAEAPLTADELKRGNSPEMNTLLERSGFLSQTPLWYYVLKEAEVRADGNTLGPVGSRIVAETIIGLLRSDRSSYLNQTPEWTPEHGARLLDTAPIRSIMDTLRFAGVAVTV